MAELDTRLPLAIQPGRAPNIPQFLGQIGLLDQQRQRRTLNELLIDKARQQQIQDAIAAQQAQQIRDIEQGATVGAAGLPGAPVVPPVGTVGAIGIPQAAGAAGTVGAPSVGTVGQVPGQGPDAAEEALIGRLTQAGQFSQALARQKQLDEKRTRRADLRAKQGANLREDMELTGRILTGVMQRSPGQQQAAYQGELPRLRGLARKHGLEAERLFPDNFDAGTVQQRLTESQETKTRVSAIIDAANAESAASRARTAAAKEEREAAEAPGEAALAERRVAASELGAQARMQAADVAGRGADERQQKRRGAIRGQILKEPAFKDMAGARQAFNIISSGVVQKSNFGDLALINGFARLLDPGSVVRPSEFETVRSVQPLANRIEAMLGRVATGEQLTDKDRQSVLRAATAIIREYESTVRDELAPVFGPIAQDAGIPLDELLRFTDTPAVDAEPATQDTRRELIERGKRFTR